MPEVMKIRGIGSIRDSTEPQGLAQTRALFVEVRTGNGIGVLELSRAAARELKDGLASTLRARGIV